MSFNSPWQSSFFVQAIALVRRVLRPWPALENRFITRVTEQQNRRVIRHIQSLDGRGKPGNLLLIMPRCVKKTGCPADVKNSLEQCLDCRECPLGDVARLCRRHDIQALVAFRSHIAFEMARTVQPDLIIATACHDRLVKALRSVPDIPALLAPLTGMDRMCVNAQVDLVWLERQLELVTGKTASPDLPAAEAPVARVENS